MEWTAALCCVLLFAAARGAEISPALVESVRTNPLDASHWRRLGKSLLDAGEVAEAYRVFRAGAARCPGDEALMHYQRVYEAWDAGDDEVAGLPIDKSSFLSLDIPSEAAPADIVAAEGGSLHLVHASKQPLFSVSACADLIRHATATSRLRGWTTDRHVHAPTCDIPCHELPAEATAWVRRNLHGKLYEAVRACFPGSVPDSTLLRCQDCFIVRYDGDGDQAESPGFASLKPHQDESTFSITVALNDRDAYEEGGLWIASTGDVLNGDAGTTLCFCGDIVHGGYPVRRGTRWIWTVFLYTDTNRSGKKPGYVLEQQLADV